MRGLFFRFPCFDIVKKSRIKPITLLCPASTLTVVKIISLTTRLATNICGYLISVPDSP